MQVLVKSNAIIKRPRTFFKGCYDCHYNVPSLCNPKIIRTASTQLHDYTKATRFLSPAGATQLTTIFDKNRIERPLLLHPRYRNPDNLDFVRYISSSAVRYDKEPLKPSSKVEVTVQDLKKQENKPTEVISKPAEKKSLKQKVVDEILHYYHGFRLLFIDMKISSVLLWRILNGKTLSRREYRLLTRTVGDMFRLLPFSVFIVVPFMELLLPFFIKFFPGLLPSTFQTTKEKEDKIKQGLKVKLEMAKFLQETLDEMSVQHKDHKSDRAKQFSEWFLKVRTSGEQVSNEEIMKFSKLFEDEITLDSLSRSQLIALCRVIEVQTLGTNNFLRFQLRMKLRSLAADDKMIQREGIGAMTLGEVQQACRARGMRAYGMSEDRLRTQLHQWLDLSLNQKVPPSLLLLSRAMMLPETIPTSDKLKATISALPETIVAQTKAAIGEKEGKIDNKVKLEVLKEEERKIHEERLEQREEQKKQEVEKIREKERAEKELLVDKAPILSAAVGTPELRDHAPIIDAEKTAEIKAESEQLQSKDFEIIESAMDSVSKDKTFVVEKGEIKELKEELADYKEDVEELNKAVASQVKPEIKVSKASQRLFKSVNRMINKLDTVLVDLEKKEEKLKEDMKVDPTEKTKQELMQIDDIIAAMKAAQNVQDDSRIDQVTRVLRKLDVNCDGAINVEDAMKVIEIIAKENIKLSDTQIDELLELIDKEELLEVEDKIEKALQKDKDTIAENKLKKQAEESEAQKSDNSQTKSEESGGSSKSMKDDTGSKPKFEAKPPIITPPVNSIDKSKSQDSSKML